MTKIEKEIAEAHNEARILSIKSRGRANKAEKKFAETLDKGKRIK